MAMFRDGAISDSARACAILSSVDLQARRVLHVEAAHRAIDLPQQARKHFARANFDKNVHALLDHFAYGVEPAHRQRDLADQRVARFVAGGDGFGIHIGDQRKSQRVKCRGAQVAARGAACAGAISAQ